MSPLCLCVETAALTAGGRLWSWRAGREWRRRRRCSDLCRTESSRSSTGATDSQDWSSSCTARCPPADPHRTEPFGAASNVSLSLILFPLLLSFRGSTVNSLTSRCRRPRMLCGHVIVSWPSWGWSQSRRSASWVVCSDRETSECRRVTWPSFRRFDWQLTELPVHLSGCSGSSRPRRTSRRSASSPSANQSCVWSSGHAPVLTSHPMSWSRWSCQSPGAMTTDSVCK